MKRWQIRRHALLVAALVVLVVLVGIHVLSDAGALGSVQADATGDASLPSGRGYVPVDTAVATTQLTATAQPNEYNNGYGLGFDISAYGLGY